MISAPLPKNEPERLRWLQDLHILDTIEEQAYDDLTFLAAQICQTPIALVSLVDRDRQWFKSHHGLDARETPRDLAFCAHAILGDDVFVVQDSGSDPRFADNPLATGDPHVKFYAGAPLVLRPGIRLGTLCVIDHKARPISAEQRRALQALARQVAGQMELRLKVQELERLDHVKDEFLSMVSHELRTPLTSINGSLSLLHHQTAGVLPGAAHNLVDIAFRNTERLLLIVNDILDIAKLEAGKLELYRHRLDLGALIERAIELNRIYCQKCSCGISFRHRSPDLPVMIMGDEQRLVQVMSNLISNAAKFSRSGDAVEIDLVVDDRMARVGVSDHGPGIASDQLRHLFTKFRQLGGVDNQKLPGTGLGLSICKQLVELHGGSIWCESTPGVRTTFYFSVPLA